MKNNFQYEIASNLDESRYIVKHSRKIKDNKITYDNIKFGYIDTNKYCIEIHVYNNTSMYAELSKIKYDKGCSVQKTLEKGIGTQNMLKVSLSLVSQLYPEIESFIFKDFSEKECDNGANIHLGYFSLVISGKTWYEKNFGAVLKDTYLQNMYIQDKEKLNKKVNEKIDLSDILEKAKVKKDLKEILLLEYNKSNSFKDFFSNLNKNFGKHMLCEYLQPWIREFMRAIDLERYFYMEWEIPVKKIQDYNVIIKDYKKYNASAGRRNITNKLKGRRRWID